MLKRYLSLVMIGWVSCLCLAESPSTVDPAALPADYQEQVMESMAHYGSEAAVRAIKKTYACSQSLVRDDGSFHEVDGYCVIATATEPDGTEASNIYFIHGQTTRFLMEL